MIGKIELYLNDNIKDISYDVTVHNVNNYIITIYMNSKLSFNEIYKHQDMFNNAVIRELEILNDTDEEGLIDSRILQRHINNEIDLLTYANQLEITKTTAKNMYDYDERIDKKLTSDELYNYIISNNINNKYIIVDDIADLNINTYNNIMNKYNNIKDIIIFRMHGNYHNYVTLNEYKKVLDKINEISIHIKSFNFSPLEEIMYTYDYVRQKNYTIEDKDLDNSGASRDLSSVLFGDKIVCQGYAQIFSAILNSLGQTRNQIYSLEGITGPGHDRNIVYVKDDKYKIDGIYFFDPTFDSKVMGENNNLCFYTYKYFARTLEEISQSNSEAMIVDKKMNDLQRYEIYDTFEILDNNEFEKIDQKVANSIRVLSKLLYNDDGISYYYCTDKRFRHFSNYTKDIDKELVEKRLDDLDYYLYNPINSLSLLSCIYEVKKKEYYEGNLDVDLDSRFLALSLLLSDKIKRYDSNQIVLAKLLNLGKKSPSTYSTEEIENYIEEKKINTDMQRVKLAKVLKDLYTKKTK